MLIKMNPKQQLIKQVSSLYCINDKELIAIDRAYDETIEKLDMCFQHVNNKYYHDEEGKTKFNPLHVGQWTMFLYQIANILKGQSSDNTDLCDKIYGLSKCFSSADIFYEIEMPDIWFFDHPQGSVMGRAKYSNFFTFSQGCTVGNNKGKFPSFGEHVSMFSNSKILGDCIVGDHVVFAANSYIIDKNIPAYSIVFGVHPNNVIHPITHKKFSELTGSMFTADE